MIGDSLQHRADGKKAICDEDHSFPAELVRQYPSQRACDQGEQTRARGYQTLVQGCQGAIGEIGANRYES